jgi:glycosyltransferase involved in cell wall biosynthesis
MIVLIGPFPPPVHGMSKNLKIFADDLELMTGCKVVRLTTSPGTLKRGLGYHISKIKNVVIALFTFFVLLCSRQVTKVYLPPDGGFGVWYSVAFSLLAAAFRKPIYYHHRSFAYISKLSLGMKVISSLQNGASSTHVFLCALMRDEFNQRYPGRYRSLIVSNAMHVRDAVSEHPLVFEGTFRLGFLSNLSFSKGLAICVDLAVELKNKGCSVELVLAGPFESDNEELYLQWVLQQYDFIDYIGPVYGDAKIEFFKKINFFVFPSAYKNEAQPNVIFEAMSFGLPVVTMQIGCVKCDVNIDCGNVATDHDNFIEESTKYLINFSSDEAAYRNSSAAVLKFIRNESTRSFANYMELLEEFKNA